MGEERKREGEVRTNEQIGSGFTPLRERPTEGDYGLTILHCVTICPVLSPQAGKGVLISDDDGNDDDDGLAPLQFRRNLCQRDSGGRGRRLTSSDLLLPCESEGGERNKIDPLEERKEGRGKRPNKKEGFQARERERVPILASFSPSLGGGVGNSLTAPAQKEK